VKREVKVNKEFKKGDKVIYGGSVYTITKVNNSGKWADIDNDTTATSAYLHDLTHYVESPTVKNQQDFNNALDQLELDFGELTGDLPEFTKKEKTNDLYCNCGIPEVITNSAYGNIFEVCLKCKKERI
jgi:hypothetical protein